MRYNGMTRRAKKLCHTHKYIGTNRIINNTILLSFETLEVYRLIIVRIRTMGKKNIFLNIATTHPEN